MLTCAILVSGGWLVGDICPAKEYELPFAGLVLDIPNDWTQVSREELAAMTREARTKAPKMNMPDYTYGFRKANGDKWGALLIQVRDGTIERDALKALPKVNELQKISSGAERKSVGLLKKISIGDTQYDSQRRIVWMRLSVGDVMGGGGMKGVSATLVREKNDIALHGYCDEASYNSFCTEFEGIVLSARARTEP
jgi:hypothetical protein